MSKQYHVAVVGATGAVGVEILKTLEHREFPVGKLKLLASSRSVGKKLPFRGKEISVEVLTQDAFEGVDFALFSAGSSTSRDFASAAVKAGAVVIDNSSAFRMEDSVPLVIPEINVDDVKQHSGIIAVPNCTTIVTMMALAPLHRKFRVRRVIASSYQAVSGSGARAIEELRRQIDEIASGKPVTREVYPYQIAFNVIPQVDDFLDTGYTREEMKMQNEGRKILHMPTFKASVTCVRVPVYRAHSISVNADFERPVSIHEAKEVIRYAPGVCLLDDPEDQVYPTPLEVAGKEECYVGRLRADCAMENGLAFWVCGDQLLKGAAQNAVQIAEALIA